MHLSCSSLVLLGLSLGLASSSELSEMKLERGGCPMFWYEFNGRCYKYVATHTTWIDAELHCVSQGANLVSIHNLEEHNFDVNLVSIHSLEEQNFVKKEF
ncbi:hypothetical protein WMY93_005413 [Mugilogobius chulae]|uniref:C-type lectin domain-containing protein n=1 Tax=Mugilogobius chulae TaxID=88201 RepID=A0AAW0PGQ0_9GOBI